MDTTSYYIIVSKTIRQAYAYNTASANTPGNFQVIYNDCRQYELAANCVQRVAYNTCTLTFKNGG